MWCGEPGQVVGADTPPEYHPDQIVPEVLWRRGAGMRRRAGSGRTRCEAMAGHHGGGGQISAAAAVVVRGGGGARQQQKI